MDALWIHPAGSILSLTALAGGVTTLILAWALVKTSRALNSAKEDLERLRESEQRLVRSQSFGQIGTWDWHIDSERLHWSDEVFTMFGYAPGEIVPSYSNFCERVHPDDRARVREGEIRCIAGDDRHDEEYRVILFNGEVRWLREIGNLIYDEAGTPSRMMGIVRDITDEKTAERSILHMAYHDDLTDLPNRVFFDARLRDAMNRADRGGKLVGLAYIDLDGFKPINDKHGHGTGDKVLIQVSQRLRTAARATDLVARVGGDEFIVILENLANPSDAEPFTQRLHEILGAPMTIANGPKCSIGASIGLAFYPIHAVTPDDLLAKADIAMYAAKRGPSLRSVVYDPDRTEFLPEAVPDDRVASSVERPS